MYLLINKLTNFLLISIAIAPKSFILNPIFQNKGYTTRSLKFFPNCLHRMGQEGSLTITIKVDITSDMYNSGKEHVIDGLTACRPVTKHDKKIVIHKIKTSDAKQKCNH